MKLTSFDSNTYTDINHKRIEFLSDRLDELQNELPLSNCIDVGCGVGFFSNFLTKRGMNVIGVDAREQNIAEARLRYPNISFLVENVENEAIRYLGKFDLVLCFGLLYHLENPMLAVRNLFSLTEKILILETRVAPYKLPIAAQLTEFDDQTQSLNGITLVPSKTSLVNMLYHAGFAEVYEFDQLPEHAEFRQSLGRFQRRTVLVATTVSLKMSHLDKLVGVNITPKDLWRRYRDLQSLFQTTRKILFKALKSLGSNFSSRLPKIELLHQDIWWLGWNDEVHRRVRNRTFEVGEREFLWRFLQPGMTVLDIGAHHGLYTLLASRRVGPKGNVIAIEPSVREQRRLGLNLKLNKVQNVDRVCIALGRKIGRSKFFVCSGIEEGCNSMRSPNVQNQPTETEVNVITLDILLAQRNIKSVNFIKIDVEGAEMDVLRGSIGILSSKDRPIIMCEMIDLRTEPWGYRSRDIYDFLLSLQFYWFTVTSTGRLTPCSRKANFHENLIAVPIEKIGNLRPFIDLQ